MAGGHYAGRYVRLQPSLLATDIRRGGISPGAAIGLSTLPYHAYAKVSGIIGRLQQSCSVLETSNRNVASMI
jgi:hypothetical protein